MWVSVCGSFVCPSVTFFGLGGGWCQVVVVVVAGVSIRRGLVVRG
jgi:hypothetical protein